MMSKFGAIVAFVLCLGLNQVVHATVERAEDKVWRRIEIVFLATGEMPSEDRERARVWVRECRGEEIYYQINVPKGRPRLGEQFEAWLGVFISETGGRLSELAKLAGAWMDTDDTGQVRITMSCELPMQEREAPAVESTTPAIDAGPEIAVPTEKPPTHPPGPSCIGLPARCALTLSTGGGLVSHAEATAVRLSAGAGLDLVGAWWILGAHAEAGIASETAQAQWYSGRLHAMWQPLPKFELGIYGEYGRGNESFALEPAREWIGWGARAVVYPLILGGGSKRVGFELLAPLGMRQFSAERELMIGDERYRETPGSLQRWGVRGTFFFCFSDRL